MRGESRSPVSPSSAVCDGLGLTGRRGRWQLQQVLAGSGGADERDV